jgi:hypothetical protein
MHTGGRVLMAAAALGMGGLAGCSHTVEFLSDPPGSRIVVNNNLIGETPCKGEFRLNTSSTLAASYEIVAYPPPGVTEVPAQYKLLGRWDVPPARMFFYFQPRREEP